MWAPVFRSQIQTFFPACLTSFITLRSIYKQYNLSDFFEESEDENTEARLRRDLAEANDQFIDPNPVNKTTAIFRLFVLTFLPGFSYFFLKRNKKFMKKEKFKKKYGTLYMNLKLDKFTAYSHTFYFCLRRLAISGMTVFSNDYLIVNIYLNIYVSILIIKYLVEHRPLNKTYLNRLELVSELFNLSLYYFMFIFTDFVP